MSSYAYPQQAGHLLMGNNNNDEEEEEEDIPNVILVGSPPPTPPSSPVNNICMDRSVPTNKTLSLICTEVILKGTQMIS